MARIDVQDVLNADFAGAKICDVQDVLNADFAGAKICRCANVAHPCAHSEQFSQDEKKGPVGPFFCAAQLMTR
jgi:hypothetical protein